LFTKRISYKTQAGVTRCKHATSTFEFIVIKTYQNLFKYLKINNLYKHHLLLLWFIPL